MKKLFFLAGALLCGVISASAARVYVQTGEEGDPTWTITLGANDKHYRAGIHNGEERLGTIFHKIDA